MARDLHCSSDKFEAVIKARTPSNVQELRAFLGLVNYYRCFFSYLLFYILLTDFSPKASSGSGHLIVNRLFKAAKSSLMSVSVLAHFWSQVTDQVAANPSSYGVLAHVRPDMTERLIAYTSRSTERKYSQVEKEGLALWKSSASICMDKSLLWLKITSLCWLYLDQKEHSISGRAWHHTQSLQVLRATCLVSAFWLAFC